MIARVLIPAILIGLFAVSGCCCPDASPNADNPQLAPERRTKKTSAELLVGTWKKISMDGKPLPKSYETTLEFTKDGKVTIRVEKSRNDVLPPPRPGKYRLEGNTIWLDTEATTESLAQSWSVTIKSVTDDKLLLTASEDRHGTEYVRVNQK